jgi:glycosyltransferase involved in cell wall biosynthesis
MNRNLVVMIPVFNEWDSLYILFRRLNQVLSPRQAPTALIIIDDGSDRTFDTDQFDLSGGSGIDSIIVLRLNRNLGHQTALVFGLAYLNDQDVPESVLVMDGDGQDDPDDVASLCGKKS